ncbi:MAG: PEP-CTERM sorting domain-containing protein, partial [Planctomycetes bacterium]|nr:PEP-CTERM sorting domain-containing protein [Planctomycetota bacterium]
GTLNISNGGYVSCKSGSIGFDSGSMGEVSVDGAGSSWNCDGSLCVGFYGQGTLSISNGGNVEVGGNLQVSSTGTLNIDSTSSVGVGGSIVFKQDSTLTAQEGAEVHMTGADFQNQSRNSANLAGLSNLTLIFEGGSAVVDDLEVAGKDDGAVLSAFSVDNFLIGTLQLGGEAAGRIKLVDDYPNQPGWWGSEALYVSNLIMNAGATIDLNGLNLYYLNGGSPKQFFNGDANLDGSVDVSDLGILAGNYGGTGKSWSEGDFDGDLVVDISDLGILAGNYGFSTGGAVPEPATLMLLLAGLGFIRHRR